MLVPIFAYAESGTIPADVGGTTYNIDYDSEGVTINSVSEDLDSTSLILAVSVTDPGFLDITLDRAFIDSQSEGSDIPYIVLADGEDVSFTETGATEKTRTLRMQLSSGTEEIEIIGTRILEGTFGTPAGAEAPVETPPVTPEQPPAEQPPSEQPETPPEEQPPVEEAPPVEEPTVPQEETSQCGPGTILKDGACVLDERCGSGTHFDNGVCVLDEKPPSTSGGPSTSSLNTSQLLVPSIVGFGIAFAIMIILWSIGKAGRNKPAAASSL